MIVGASVLQLPAIIKAKEMGLEVAVVDFNPKAIGINYADKYYNASTIDEEEVVKAAIDYKPDGIMTLATDMPMRGVARAAERLNLSSIKYTTALKATDKYEMIKAFKKSKVASPWYYLVNNYKELSLLEDKLTYPCIMKPTDNAGSHGVTLVSSYKELLEKYEYCHNNSRCGKVIIEEYLIGEEVSVEAIVINGKINILQITDKITTGAPFFVEIGHTQPSRKSAKIQLQIKALAEQAIKSLDIDKGPCHIEIMVTDKGPVMIELGARMGGDNIATHLIPLSTGIDMTEVSIRIALGEIPSIKPSFNQGAAIRYVSAPTGKIKLIEGIDKVRTISEVKEVTFIKNIGDTSKEINCSNDRIGFIIVQAENAIQASKICENAVKQINIEVSND